MGMDGLLGGLLAGMMKLLVIIIIGYWFTMGYYGYYGFSGIDYWFIGYGLDHYSLIPDEKAPAFSEHVLKCLFESSDEPLEPLIMLVHYHLVGYPQVIQGHSHVQWANHPLHG